MQQRPGQTRFLSPLFNEKLLVLNVVVRPARVQNQWHWCLVLCRQIVSWVVWCLFPLIVSLLTFISYFISCCPFVWIFKAHACSSFSHCMVQVWTQADFQYGHQMWFSLTINLWCKQVINIIIFRLSLLVPDATDRNTAGFVCGILMISCPELIVSSCPWTQSQVLCRTQTSG